MEKSLPSPGRNAVEIAADLLTGTSPSWKITLDLVRSYTSDVLAKRHEVGDAEIRNLAVLVKLLGGLVGDLYNERNKRMLQLSERPTEEELLAFLKTVLLANPELFAANKPQNHNSDAGCFMRAFRLGEPTFTLRAQDETAADIVDEWLTRNKQLSLPRSGETMKRIGVMRAWPTKKKAD